LESTCLSGSRLRPPGLEWNEGRGADEAVRRAARDFPRMQDFHRLKVWQKAHALAVEVFRLTEALPRRDGVALASQLRRAALSIPANIAEGAGKGSNAEFHRFLQVALGSASETLYHLLLARDVGIIEVQRYDALSSAVVEIRRMLTGLAKRVGTADSASKKPFVPNPPRQRDPSTPADGATLPTRS
jgi:four helix bundle protein